MNFWHVHAFDAMFTLPQVVSVGEKILRPIVVYLFLVVLLRVFGKREVGQFTIFDLVLVLLVANAVQPAMTGPDSSVTGGLIIMKARSG